MWNKVYAGILLLAIVLISGSSLYAYSWLSSIGDPRSALANYGFFAGLATMALWCASLVLLAIGNVILWTSRNAWALWTTFVFFAVFTIVDYFVLSPAAFAFKKSNGLWQGEFSLSYFVGAGIVIVVGVLVFMNQYVNVRLNRKMYAVEEVAAETADEVETPTE
jgi:hypothetical protein